MCGIIGFTGTRPCADFLLDGLEKLEYRGYDSAGVTALEGGRFTTEKAVGRIANLRALVQKNGVPCAVGIGHTR